MVKKPKSGTSHFIRWAQEMDEEGFRKLTPRYRKMVVALLSSNRRKLTFERDGEDAIEALASGGEPYAQALMLSRAFAKMAATLHRSGGRVSKKQRATLDVPELRRRLRFYEKCTRACWDVVSPTTGLETRINLMVYIDVLARGGAWPVEETGFQKWDAIGREAHERLKPIVTAWANTKRGAKPSNSPNKDNGFELLSKFYASQGEQVSAKTLRNLWATHLASIGLPEDK